MSGAAMELDFDVYKLIQLVSDCPAIYDCSVSAFKNPERKDKAWANIAGELKANEEECRKRWRTLRERYTRELKRVKNDNPEEQTIIISWPYFKAMDFLQKHIKLRRSRYVFEKCKMNSSNSSSISAAQKYETITPVEKYETTIIFPKNEADPISFSNQEFKFTGQQGENSDFPDDSSMHEQHIELEEEHDEEEEDDDDDEEEEDDECRLDDEVAVVEENVELEENFFDNNHHHQNNNNSQPEQQLLNTMAVTSATANNIDKKMSKKRKLSVTEGTITAYVDVDEYQESHQSKVQQQHQQQQQQQSEDDLFCSGVACSLKKLSRLHNIKAKVEIYKVLEKFITLEEKA